MCQPDGFCRGAVEDGLDLFDHGLHNFMAAGGDPIDGVGGQDRGFDVAVGDELEFLGNFYAEFKQGRQAAANRCVGVDRACPESPLFCSG